MGRAKPIFLNYSRRLIREPLEKYIEMVRANELAMTDQLADMLRARPNVLRHAQDYARRVEDSESVINPDEEDLSDDDYETGDEWEGDSCPGSPVDSDWPDSSDDDNVGRRSSDDDDEHVGSDDSDDDSDGHNSNSDEDDDDYSD